MTRLIRTTLNVLLVGFAVCATSDADSITYSGSFSTDSGIASYTITTDGNTGTLTQSDIISATISDVGTDAFSSTPVTDILSAGTDLDFNSTTVTFDFSGSDQGHLLLVSGSNNHSIEFCATGGCGGYAPGDSGETVDPNYPLGDIIPLSGTQVIAAAAPEPATLSTTFGGALLLGFAALRCHRQTRRSRSYPKAAFE